jgi:hypothetical protein
MNDERPLVSPVWALAILLRACGASSPHELGSGAGGQVASIEGGSSGGQTEPPSGGMLGAAAGASGSSGSGFDTGEPTDCAPFELAPLPTSEQCNWS